MARWRRGFAVSSAGKSRRDATWRNPAEAVTRRDEFLRWVAFRRVSFGDSADWLYLVSEGGSAAGYRAEKFISSLKWSYETGLGLIHRRHFGVFQRGVRQDFLLVAASRAIKQENAAKNHCQRNRQADQLQ